MKPSIKWPFPQTHLEIDDPDTEIYARWFFENFSPMAIEVLNETIWIFLIRSKTWLNPAIARLFGSHIEQMESRIHYAIARGDVKAKMPPKLKGENQAQIIGAIICELIYKGELDARHLYKNMDCRLLVEKNTLGQSTKTAS